ncbi:MAG: barstar family protein [Lysobacter sp.]
MNAVDLRALLADPSQAGAFFVDARDSDAMVEAGETLDYEVLRIDFVGCHGKARALDLIGEALQFPDWVGDNWDALADALNDLSWLPANGYLLLLEHTSAWREHAPEEVEVLLGILNETAVTWAGQDTAFWTLLPLPAADLAALPA